MLKSSCATALFLLGLAFAEPVRAERYALLIGISSYPAYPKLHLDGPKEDVPALRNALITSWHYPDANIISLIDQNATKGRILESLDALIAKVRPGDQVFVYYSGHGTSAFDPKNKRLGIPLNSGASIPSDVRQGPLEGLLNQFIIGLTDLRPRLRALDAKASTFVVIDSCYSGTAVKSIADGFLTSREAPLAVFMAGNRMAPDDYDAAYSSIRLPTVDPNDYPYGHLVFLSASAQSEKAYEVNESALKIGVFQTIDGRPHGLLTDSLLRALRGEADADHDGKITYEEVHRFVSARVMQQGQTPQLLPRNLPGLTREPIFGIVPAPSAPSNGSRNEGASILVSVSPAAQSLVPELSDLPGIRLVKTQAADLAIAKIGHNYALYLANGVQIHEYAPSEIRELRDRVRREPDLKLLREWSFKSQAFHAVLHVEPANRDAYAVGERLDFHLSADRSAYLLLVNIDVSGWITILHKSPAGQPARANEDVAVATHISAPVGTEYMILFAFSELPPGWVSLKPLGFPPADPQFRRLMETLEAASPSSARTSWLTYSTDRRLAAQ